MLERHLHVFVAGLLACAPAARAGTVETVAIGDPGNAPDTRYDPGGVGAVANAFQIGRLEITNGQYREFLNAKAAIGDPFALYSANMAGSLGGIERSGSGTAADPWVYSPKGGAAAWDLRPVNFVNFWDAARFCNWLYHGGGDGDTESGSYVNVGNQAQFARTAGATWAIPTEDEWYKAAYYKGSGPNAGYWDYATQSDVLPSAVPPELDDGNAANWGHVAGAPFWSTPVGAYSLSAGPYGTLDQNGNIGEWIETVGLSPSSRKARGGAWGANDDYGMAAWQFEALSPDSHYSAFGFRVAYVPEPSALLIALLGIMSTRRAR